VAFSGGLDSSALLQVLVDVRGPENVRAIHINHGLQQDACRWAESCHQVSEALGVDLTVVPVEVDLAGSASVEAAARQARYEGLAANLSSGEILLTAHHADDQLETMLLAILRGAGLRGLRGALELANFGPGLLLRPFLHLSRATIHGWAVERGIRWLEDPSNRDIRFDRNYLRRNVLPDLLARWPAAGAAASRAAGHLDAAVGLTEQLADEDIARLDDRYRPLAGQLAQLAADRQRNLLRALLRSQGLPVPSAAQLDRLLVLVASATTAGRGVVQWPGGEARLYRGRLYLAAAFRPAPSAVAARLGLKSAWLGPLGSLSLRAASAGGMPAAWARAGLEVRESAGGERFQPAGSQRPRSLSRLLQDTRVLPWLRPWVPLLYFHDQLVAVGDLWLSEEAVAADPSSELRYQINWQRSRPIF
jgi:tRNA(Ile)-lysidine synthase